MKIYPNIAKSLLADGNAKITGTVDQGEVRYYVLDNYLDQRTDHVVANAKNSAFLAQRTTDRPQDTRG